MANVLNIDKQIAIIGQLAEGSSIRSIEELQEIILKLHGADATHRESVPVKEIWNGQTVWDGVVEVFDLEGHPEANTAYAWSHETDEGTKRHVAVLHIPPVVDAITAVRAAFMRDYHAAQA